MKGVIMAIKEVAEVVKDVAKKEVQELPDEIGESSKVDYLPDEIGDELQPNSIYEIDGIKYEKDYNSSINSYPHTY